MKDLRALLEGFSAMWTEAKEAGDSYWKAVVIDNLASRGLDDTATITEDDIIDIVDCIYEDDGLWTEFDNVIDKYLEKRGIK